MRYLPRVLRYLRPHWRAAAVSVVAAVVVSLLALLEPWPLKVLFDSVLGSVPVPPAVARVMEPLKHDKVTLLLVVVAAGFALTLVGNALKVLNSYYETRVSQRMTLDFRSELFRHAQRLSLDYHDRTPGGALIYNINFQADAAAGLVMALLPLLRSALTLVGMFWVTARIDPMLALVSLAVVPLLYYSAGHYVTRIQPRLRDVRNLEGESLSIIHEAISMIRVILAFGREDHEFQKFRRQGQRAVDARVDVTVRQVAFSLMVNTATAGGTAAVLAFGAFKILNGTLTPGELLVVLAYVASLYKPLETITNTVSSLQERFIALEMAFELLDTEPRVRDRPGAVKLPRARGEIVFDEVAFTYDGRSHTLSGVSFGARAGEVIGIVGPTGAGKSTLMSLLPRFYEPVSGTITLDGIDVRGIELVSLRSQISVVLQESLLFSGTIADNIRYARPEATTAEIEAAARAANAHEFIVALPQGYDTTIGEKGVRLSGGERQRVAVARAFLKDAPILILDEPTSSIDSRTEAVILDALERLIVGRTTFMIAHRLSTLRRPDRILVVDSGRIVEQGPIPDLLARGGLFARLWQAQRVGAPHGNGGHPAERPAVHAEPVKNAVKQVAV
ncbi:MAG TPA: ABC transporter ATP-binding protein [Gemmatimonadaceae bacterium]|nr:ABC transporter ATP-binding protein [Gemmatimonadaceae bacterium]